MLVDSHRRRTSREPHNSTVRWGRLVLSILVLSAATAAIPHGQNSSTTSTRPRLRKNVTALTAAERKDFVDAVLTLKRARSPYDKSLNYYDQFVQWHKDRYVCRAAGHADAATMAMIHAGPMFLPWHRELLRRFEDALRGSAGRAS